MNYRPKHLFIYMYTRKFYFRYFNEDTLLIFKILFKITRLLFSICSFPWANVCAVGLIDIIKEGTDAVQGK